MCCPCADLQGLLATRLCFKACQRDETSNVSHRFEEESPTSDSLFVPLSSTYLAEGSQLGKGINEKDENKQGGQMRC